MLILCPPDPTAHSGFVLGRGVLENAHDFAHFNIFPSMLSVIGHLCLPVSKETSLLEDTVALRHGHQRRNPRGVNGRGGGENAALQ